MLAAHGGSMKFKATKISVNPNSPFEHDKLDRKPHVENLSTLLKNISSPIVFSINAPWGTGKTTFLEMLKATLSNEKCNSVYFSAWETDFAEDPLLAFLGEMNKTLESLVVGNKAKRKALNIAKKAGKQILVNAIPIAVKLSTAGLVDIKSEINDGISTISEEFSKDLIKAYTRDKKAIETFKNNIAKVLKNKGGKVDNLYLFVDELDRCRPTYAIELLERIKHLFDIEGLVFVLALDKKELSHGVKAVYGSGFDAQGYLKRFIDIEYDLPEPEIDNFIEYLNDIFDFSSFYKSRTGFRAFAYDSEQLKDAIKLFAIHKKLSLRDIEQLFSKINLVVKSTEKNTYLYPSILIYLIIVKADNPTIYNQFIRPTSSPIKMISLLHDIVPEAYRYKAFPCALIEGLLLACKKSSFDVQTDQLIKKYKENMENHDNHPELYEYSRNVLEVFKRPVEITDNVSLTSIVNRLELLEAFNFDT